MSSDERGAEFRVSIDRNHLPEPEWDFPNAEIQTYATDSTPDFPTHATGPGGRALAEDFSQAEDLADQHPDKVRELQDKFMAAAAKYNVFPLDDRFADVSTPRCGRASSPAATRSRSTRA